MTDTPDQQAPAFINARAAAGVLFTNEQGEILMVTPSYKPYLDIPGGYVEPGESPSQAAVREVKEELGIDVELGQLLVVDWWTEGIEQPEGAKILFIFDVGSVSQRTVDQMLVDGVEIVDAKFYSLSDLEHLTVPRLSGRLRNAVAAKNSRLTRYLEEGCLVGVGDY